MDSIPDFDWTNQPLYWTSPLPKKPKIPKILHQLWIGPARRPARLMATWRDKHPDWTYILWDEQNLKDFGFKNQHLIDAMPRYNGKADIMRYEILHRMGGVFLDADSECLNPLDVCLLENDSIACYENEAERGDLVACGIMGATENNRLMGLCVQELKRAEEPCWYFLGPGFFTWVINKHLYADLKIYPSHWFLPLHYATGVRYAGTDKVYADHHWGTTNNAYDDLS